MSNQTKHDNLTIDINGYGPPNIRKPLFRPKNMMDDDEYLQKMELFFC